MTEATTPEGTYGTILVVVDDAPSVPARLDAALLLARRFEAHLTGFAAIQPIDIPDYVIPEVADAMRAARREASAALAREIEQRFEGQVAPALPRERWNLAVAANDPVSEAIAESRYADIVVAGQVEPGRTGRTIRVPPEELLLSAGRPVLVVPYAGPVKSLGQRVLVAWNGSREAARALHDALPLLARADSVQVLHVIPRHARPAPGPSPERRLSEVLARHGIAAELIAEPSLDLDPADLLLNQAADSGADLIVMGAYGRSRVRELVLGGVTRGVLQHMTVPVLLSH